MFICKIAIISLYKSDCEKNDLVSFAYYSLRLPTKIRHDMHSRINIHERTHARIDSDARYRSTLRGCLVCDRLVDLSR